MKNLSFLIIFFCLTTLSAQAQWKVGAHFGPGGSNVTDAYKVNLGIDAYYMFRNPDAFFKYGINAGFSVFPPNEFDLNGIMTKLDPAPFIPIALAFRFTLFKVITFGPDIGVGLALNENVEPGLHLKGVFGFDIANAVELNLYGSINSTEDQIEPYPNEFVSFGAGFLIHIY